MPTATTVRRVVTAEKAEILDALQNLKTTRPAAYQAILEALRDYRAIWKTIPDHAPQFAEWITGRVAQLEGAQS